MKNQSTIKQKVSWGDMDAFGHVNNTVYLKYFESARIEYFAQIPAIGGFVAKDAIPVVATISCSFKKPVVYPDMLEMRVKVAKMGAASMEMTCDMVSSKVGLAAQASCTIVMINPKKGGSVRIPEEWRQAIEAFEEM
jgi:acyl-CoA thioester hydrolase